MVPVIINYHDCYLINSWHGHVDRTELCPSLVFRYANLPTFLLKVITVIHLSLVDVYVRGEHGEYCMNGKYEHG